MSFARASTQKDSVELQHGPGRRPEIRRDTLTAYGERLDAQTWPPRTMLVNDAQRDMPFADFVMDFYVGRNGLITRCRGGAARNRVVTFRPIYSSDPRGDKCPDYCRNRLVRFRPWNGDLQMGGVEPRATSPKRKTQINDKPWWMRGRTLQSGRCSYLSDSVLQVSLRPTCAQPAVVAVANDTAGKTLQQGTEAPTRATAAAAARIAKTSRTSAAFTGTQGHDRVTSLSAEVSNIMLTTIGGGTTG